MKPLVGIIMGSPSDWETMQSAAELLDTLAIPYEVRVVSAHRTPDLLFEYASGARARGLEVLIAGRYPAIATALEAYRERQTAGVLGKPDPRATPRT